MTLRQRILKIIYPFLMKFAGQKKEGKVLENKSKIEPPQPFYQLKTTANDGKEINFGEFRNKKVLLVNTASNCGFTQQYEELQKLYEQNKNSLVVIGFPANDFKEQEKADDAEIAQFCQINFGVTFQLAKKTKVVRGDDQNEVFKWLTDPKRNGWNNHQPDWNFSKYLIDEKGKLTHYFAPTLSPLADEVTEVIKK